MNLDHLSQRKRGPEGLQQLAIILDVRLRESFEGFQGTLGRFTTLIEVIESDLKGGLLSPDVRE